jgi:hypothetical protein
VRISSLAKSHAGGFTLVELLVTMIVLFILAGLSVVNAGMVRQSAFDASATQDYRNILLALESLTIDDAFPERLRIPTVVGPQSLEEPLSMVTLSPGVRLSRFSISNRPNVPVRPTRPNPAVGGPPGLNRSLVVTFDVEHLRGSKRLRYTRVGDEIVEQVVERS